MARKTNSKAAEPSVRDQRSADFIEALAADWKQFGPGVIVAMREESPVKYSELVARLIPLETILRTHSPMLNRSKISAKSSWNRSD